MISTATRPRMGTGPAIVPGWAVLVIDELWLAMPQRDVRQFALASDLEASGANLAQAGGQPLAGSGESWPVYSLDGSLQLQREAGAWLHVVRVLVATPDGDDGGLVARDLPRDGGVGAE